MPLRYLSLDRTFDERRRPNRISANPTPLSMDRNHQIEGRSKFVKNNGKIAIAVQIMPVTSTIPPIFMSFSPRMTLRLAIEVWVLSPISSNL